MAHGAIRGRGDRDGEINKQRKGEEEAKDTVLLGKDTDSCLRPFF